MKSKIIAIIVLVILVICAFANKDKFLKTMYPKMYQEEVSASSEKYKVEEHLIFAVIKAESNFDTNAISNREAIRNNAINGKNSKRSSTEKLNRNKYG